MEPEEDTVAAKDLIILSRGLSLLGNDNYALSAEHRPMLPAASLHLKLEKLATTETSRNSMGNLLGEAYMKDLAMFVQ